MKGLEERKLSSIGQIHQLSKAVSQPKRQDEVKDGNRSPKDKT